MKIKFLLFGVVFFTAAFFVFVFNTIPRRAEAKIYTEEEIERIKALFVSSEVIADISDTTDIFSDYSLKNKVGKVNRSDKVEILMDRGTEVYFIRAVDGEKEGWISGENINIPSDPETNTRQVDKEYIEDFANIMEFESDTEYFVFVDIDRQMTYILKGLRGSWNLYRSIKCGTGKNVSPTTRGFFKISDKGKWFYSERLGSGAINWVRFNGSYLFHSVAMDKNKNVVDDTLGKRCSSGCVRMSVEDTEWFYQHIKAGTGVFVY